VNDLSNFAHTAHHARRVVSAGNVIEHQHTLINKL
jgi:ribosomal protein S4